MRGTDVLNHIVATLQELGGYFSFPADDGEEVIIGFKKDVESWQQKNTEEVQLVFPPVKEGQADASSVLDKINQDIALYRAQQQQEEAFDDIGLGQVSVLEATEQSSPLPPPRRVRFEPLRGDLPPDLQE
ncbi:MAG: hypothetical protein WEA04_00930 [Candidatus Andersenbacteria bacterium]